MGYLLEKCTLSLYDENILKECTPFDCGDSDLNEFFSLDVLKYTSELLGKSYCFISDDDTKTIVAAFTVSNDSIKTFTLPNSRKKKIIQNIPREKQMRTYPAVLIGRLGVHESIRKERKSDSEKSIGDELMDFIKSWFIDKSNKTGCRYIVVDAYNNEKTLSYYKRNGFMPVFSVEEQEKKSYGLPKEATLNTRLLYFDLIILSKENTVSF